MTDIITQPNIQTEKKKNGYNALHTYGENCTLNSKLPIFDIIELDLLGFLKSPADQMPWNSIILYVNIPLTFTVFQIPILVSMILSFS